MTLEGLKLYKEDFEIAQMTLVRLKLYETDLRLAQMTLEESIGPINTTPSLVQCLLYFWTYC